MRLGNKDVDKFQISVYEIHLLVEIMKGESELQNPAFDDLFGDVFLGEVLFDVVREIT